ncbi:MAG: MCE family protein [Deltaproteobacteria bacterium]|nr:MCE family protein [Deltaproteobacteria bacterium]
MKEWKSGIKVGVVVIAILGLTYYAFKRVHEGVGGGGYTIHAKFKDATGLVNKSRVVIAGLRVGEIIGKNLVGKKADISILVEKKYKFYSNACIYKKTASLMGQFYLEIDPGTPTSPDLEHPNGPPHQNQRIKSGGEITCVHEAATMDKLMRQVEGLTPELKGLVTDIRKMVRGPLAKTVTTTNHAIETNADALHRIIVKADSIATDVKKITGPIPPDVVRTIHNIRNITDHTRAVVSDARTLIQTSNGAVASTRDRLAKTLDKLDHAIQNLDRSLNEGPGISRDIKGITKDVRHVTDQVARGKGNLGKFLKDETIADNVKQVARDTKVLVRSVSALQTIVGLRSEYNVLAGTLKSYVSVRIQPSPDKYYLIELVDDPRGNMTNEETIVHDGDQDGPVISHTTKQTVKNKFRFTFQFAKRIDFATFRFGIKENTGGVGVDLSFLKDSLLFSTDAFDFSTNQWPRLRFMLKWEFYKHISFVAGVDDVLNGTGGFGGGVGRDYFVGAQVTFNDQDLKTLLLFGGSAVGAAASQ